MRPTSRHPLSNLGACHCSPLAGDFWGLLMGLRREGCRHLNILERSKVDPMVGVLELTPTPIL